MGLVEAKVLDRHGQMTVELMVALPVLIAVAVVLVNALSFMGECAAFDRLARDAVRVCAASPGYGCDVQRCAADAQALLAHSFDDEGSSVSVEVEGRAMGCLKYQAELLFVPTLFGRSFSGNVFGVEFFPLRHRVYLVVDPYRPGVVA